MSTSAAAALVLLAALRPAGEGRVLRVPADHPTIQKAVDAAGDGDTVIVSPGTYRERVRLKPGVTVRSAGDDAAGKAGLARAEAAVLDGEEKADAGPGVVMAERSTLDGFTVTRCAKFDPEEFDRHYATRGANQGEHREAGRPDAPVAVLARGVTAVVRHNIVRDNGDVGIDCTGGGGRNASVIAANVVFRNMGAGIGVADGAIPLVQGNRCFRNFLAGIGSRASSAVILGNECFDNVRSGIGVSGGARPVIRGNRCHKNRRAGIASRNEGTSPLIEDNDCFDNGLGGITARLDAEPTIRGNRCHGNGGAGIGFEETKSGKAVVAQNKVGGTGAVAVGIHGGWKVRVSGNELTCKEGMPPVVMIYAGAEADLSENVIRGAGVAAIRVEGTVRATGNTLECLSPRRTGPPSYGVWALPKSDVAMVDNTVRDWRHALSAEEAAVSATGNRVSGYHSSGFRIDKPAGTAVVAGNRLESESGQPAVSLSGGAGLVEDNRVEKPSGAGSPK
jgi:parallel beta-helix repeat protein